MKKISDLITEGEILYLIGLPEGTSTGSKGYLWAEDLQALVQFKHLSREEARIVNSVYNREGKLFRDNGVGTKLIHLAIENLLNVHPEYINDVEEYYAKD